MAPFAARTESHTIHLPVRRPAGVATARKHGGRLALLSQPLTFVEVEALLQDAFDVAGPGCWGRAAPARGTWHDVIVDAVLAKTARIARELGLARTQHIVLAQNVGHASPATTH